MMAGTIGASGLTRLDLLKDVVEHSRLAFSSAWMRFDEAERGEMNLVPPDAMRPAIAADYAAMKGMIFGEVPSFDAVMHRVEGVAAAYSRRRQTGHTPPA